MVFHSTCNSIRKKEQPEMTKLAALSFAMMVFAGAAYGQEKATEKTDKADKEAKPPLNVTMKSLDGKEVDLAEKYHGKVVLLVNVASQCGLTPQYEQLQALHDK
jgi:glutathione peroxidase